MKNVEDIYPLSPMQELMLLSSLVPTGPNTLVDQGCYTLEGVLNVAQFQRSWQQIIDRHPALRTCFVWDGLKQPLQVVRQRAELSFQEFDLSTLSSDEQKSRIGEFRKQDQARGFELSRAPLVRVAVFRLGNEESYCVCTSHHLILDRWCISILHDELAHFYSGGSVEVARPTPFRNYIAWVQQRDPKAAEDFWTTQLSGLETPTSVITGVNGGRDGESGGDYDECSLPLSDQATCALRDFASQNYVTLPTVVQMAWALALNHLTGQPDIVFGLTVAGRPLGLAGVESIVGSFINNIPVRIRLDSDSCLLDAMRSLHRVQQQMRQFEYVSASELHQWSGLSPQQRLFDSLLVWAEHIPDPDPDSQLTMRAAPGPIRTAAPLTAVLVDGGGSIDIQISCFRGFSYRANAQQTLQVLCDKLSAVLNSPTKPVHELIRTQGTEARTIEVGSPESPQAVPNELADTKTKGQAALEQDVELQALTQQLEVEWGHVLGMPVRDHCASFFELGGTSFQAAHLHRQLQMITRKEVSLIDLFLSPTIEEMAKLLHRSQVTSSKTISAFQPEGSLPPLFCIATPGSNPIGYVALARHLDKNRPLYLIQAPPSEEQPERLSPDELADCVAPYIEAIRSVEESGPYCLVGMCWGAYLAFDIARELSRTGQQIGFLGILDTWAKYTLAPQTYGNWLSIRRRYYASRLRAYWQLPPRERFSRIGGAVGRKLGAVKQKLVGLRGPPTEVRAWDEHVHYTSNRDLAQQQFEGCVTIFRRPNQPRRRIGDRGLGWSQFANSVDVRMLACEEEDYTAILREPYVRDAARQIEEKLRTI